MKIRIEFSSHLEYQLVSLGLSVGAVLIAALALFSVRKRGIFHAVFGWFGVGLNRFKRALNEFRRKAIHFLGLLIPVIYIWGIHFHMPPKMVAFFHWTEDPTALFTPFRGAVVLFTLFVAVVIFELFRLYFPGANGAIHARWGALFRASERRDFSGSVFYLGGACIAVYFFPPLLACCSLFFLTIGDFSAAIFGTIFGKTKLIGKKSLEGTTACFVTSMMSGVSLLALLAPHFGEPNLGAWLLVVAAGSFTTALVELVSPGHWLNDNLTIPPTSAFAMAFAARLLVINVALA